MLATTSERYQLYLSDREWLMLNVQPVLACSETLWMTNTLQDRDSFHQRQLKVVDPV